MSVSSRSYSSVPSTETLSVIKSVRAVVLWSSFKLSTRFQSNTCIFQDVITDRLQINCFKKIRGGWLQPATLLLDDPKWLSRPIWWTALERHTHDVMCKTSIATTAVCLETNCNHRISTSFSKKNTSKHLDFFLRMTWSVHLYLLLISI